MFGDDEANESYADTAFDEDETGAIEYLECHESLRDVSQCHYSMSKNSYTLDL